MHQETNIREFILNCKEPTVLSDLIKEWSISSYTISDWNEIFQNKSLPFRCGAKYEYKEDPIWERKCKTMNLTFEDFIKLSQDDTSMEWLYFDYKYMKNYFKKDVIDVDWSNLGFPELSLQDSTIWIGSSGAHTPCHIDAYGCNLIAQIYGRKLWFLVPPMEMKSMMPTRVPYEESSIYSCINFHTPNKKLFDIPKLYKVILEAGDVLVVPRHWWHYVENVDLAISINTWLPLKEDHLSRVQEFLVRTFVQNICQNLSEDKAKLLLNPNEDQLMNEDTDSELLKHLMKCIKEECGTVQEQTKTDIDCENVKYNRVKLCTRSEVEKYIEEKQILCGGKINKLDEEIKEINGDESLECLKKIINSFCHPDTIQVAVNNLMNDFSY